MRRGFSVEPKLLGKEVGDEITAMSGAMKDEPSCDAILLGPCCQGSEGRVNGRTEDRCQLRWEGERYGREATILAGVQFERREVGAWHMADKTNRVLRADIISGL